MQVEYGPDLKLHLTIQRFATPFVILLVGTGIAYAPAGGTRILCATLLALSVGFNMAVFEWMKSSTLSPLFFQLRQLRQAFNFLVNSILVFVLGWYWEPIWLLLLLTPLITALSLTRKENLFVALGAAVELLAINGLRVALGADAWAHQVVYALAIVLISTLVSEVAGQLKSPKLWSPQLDARR